MKLRFTASLAVAYIGIAAFSYCALQLLGSRQFLPLAGTAAFSLLAVVLVSGMLLKRMVLAPISRLADSARQVARGDFDVFLPVDSGDEIGALTRCFNEMAQTVKDHTGDLERSVAQRTRQFTAIHEELLTANEELHARRSEAEATLEALQASEEQLRLLLDSTAEAIYGTDLEGRCTFCNSTCLRLLGYAQPGELVGKDMHWLVHRLLSDEEPRLLDIRRKEQRVHLEGELLWRADGSSFPAEFWSYPQHRNGRVIGAVATFLDVSERILAQERVLKLSRAVENSPAIVVITDRAGCIEYVNPKFTEITGYLAEEAIGQNPRILNAGVQSKEFYRQLWETISAGREWRGEFCNRKKNGETHWEYASISPIRDEKGGITHFVAVKEDVTERKLVAEELLQAKDAADAANRYKSEFLANMSHEIRTPLNAIIGFSELARKEGLGEDYAEKINAAGKTLLGIVNDILDFSKVEAGKLTMEQTCFGMEQTVAGVLTVVRPKALEKGLALLLELPPEVCGAFAGDPLRLGQVLTNLVSNAIKFTEKGEVKLSVRLRAQQAERAELLFSVSDTGIGLSAESLSRLFQPFTQADGSTTRRFGGTGLGLSISKQLVELMGGELWAESLPGLGSVFTFTAWFGTGRELVEPGAVLPSPAAPGDFSGLRVLLAEDNEVNRQLAIILLTGVGAQVQVAVNGRQALEMVLAAEPRFDLVLMDIQMPELDGYQATWLIREDPRFGELPVIALTAHAMLAERQKMLAAGMNDFIIKPIDSRLMFTTMARHLRRPRDGEEGADQPAVPRIPGVDASAALNRLDGNRKLYLWLLHAFLESEADTAAAVDRALGAGELALAERLVHTTKGSAGSIGADALMQAGALLENAIAKDASEQALRQAQDAFRLALERLLGELSLALPTEVPGPTPATEPPLDRAAVGGLLHRLQRRIVESDGSALDCLDERSAQLSGLPGEELARLKGLLAAFDYDAALPALTALAAKAGISLDPDAPGEAAPVRN